MSGMPEGDGYLVTDGGNGRIGDGFSIHVSCVIREAKDRIHEDLAEL
jgi:CDP-diacylglycerol pyrophosphatase